jgi:hypothetical protein
MVGPISLTKAICPDWLSNSTSLFCVKPVKGQVKIATKKITNRKLELGLRILFPPFMVPNVHNVVREGKKYRR